jgi:hypothetical protein
VSLRTYTHFPSSQCSKFTHTPCLPMMAWFDYLFYNFFNTLSCLSTLVQLERDNIDRAMSAREDAALHMHTTHYTLSLHISTRNKHSSCYWFMRMQALNQHTLPPAFPSSNVVRQLVVDTRHYFSGGARVWRYPPFVPFLYLCWKHLFEDYAVGGLGGKICMRICLSSSMLCLSHCLL